MDNCFTNSDLVIGNLFFTYFFSLSFFLSLSDKVEKGRFFPEPSAPYFSKAAAFSIVSKSLIERTIFRFFKSFSARATSRVSPPVHLSGRASAVFKLIADFLLLQKLFHRLVGVYSKHI